MDSSTEEPRKEELKLWHLNVWSNRAEGQVGLSAWSTAINIHYMFFSFSDG